MSSTSCSARLKTFADNYWSDILIVSCLSAGVVMVVISNIKTPHTREWALFLAYSIVLMATPLLTIFTYWYGAHREWSANIIAAVEVWLIRFIFLISFLMASLIICTAAITSTGWHLPTILTVGCLLMLLTCLSAFCSLHGVDWRTFLHTNRGPILLVSTFIAGLLMVVVSNIKTSHTWEWAVFLAASVVLMATPLMIVLVVIVLHLKKKLTDEIQVWLERVLFFICFSMAALIICVAGSTTTGSRLPTIIIVGCLLMIVTGLLFYFSFGMDTNV